MLAIDGAENEVAFCREKQLSTECCEHVLTAVFNVCSLVSERKKAD